MQARGLVSRSQTESLVSSQQISNHLGTLQIPLLHFGLQNILPVCQNCVWADALQQAPGLHRIFKPAHAQAERLLANAINSPLIVILPCLNNRPANSHSFKHMFLCGLSRFRLKHLRPLPASCLQYEDHVMGVLEGAIVQWAVSIHHLPGCYAAFAHRIAHNTVKV